MDGIQFNICVHRKYNKSCPTSTKLPTYRRTREVMETKVILLLEFKHWLGNRIKELFNPTANIIASQESNRKNNPLKTINAGHISKKETIK